MLVMYVVVVPPCQDAICLSRHFTNIRVGQSVFGQVPLLILISFGQHCFTKMTVSSEHFFPQ